jgi:hypothetical protein
VHREAAEAAEDMTEGLLRQPAEALLDVAESCWDAKTGTLLRRY